jgi:hypothetical protein
MRQPAVLICFLLVSVLACGTAQIGDSLILDGKRYEIFTNPLKAYIEADPARHPHRFTPRKDERDLPPMSTGNWRGYIATWEIVGDTLVLTDVETLQSVEPEKESSSTTDYRSVFEGMFPGQQQVLAAWFTGHIVIPDGKLVNYVHMGYASTFEKYLILRVEKGVLVRRWTADTKSFLKFRDAQFAAFQKTAEYRDALKDSMKDGTKRSDAEEFLREFYSEDYLSAIYDAAPPQ